MADSSIKNSLSPPVSLYGTIGCVVYSIFFPMIITAISPQLVLSQNKFKTKIQYLGKEKSILPLK